MRTMATGFPGAMRGVLTVVMSATLCSPALAAPAWFGVAGPPDVDAGPTSFLGIAGADLPATPASFGPGPMSPVLSGGPIKADVARIVDFSYQSKAAGDYLWGRVSGTPAYYRTVSWAVGEMKRAGLSDAHVEDFDATLSIPIAGAVHILADVSFGEGTKDIVLRSAMVGGRGPVNGRVTAPLIYVGHATMADRIGRDVRGKIAVFKTVPNPGSYAADEIGRSAELIKAGAAGVIEILQQPGNMQSYDADRHGCGTGLCFTVGGADGYFLETVLGKAGEAHATVSASLSAEASIRTGLKSGNGVATIAGRSNRTIIIEAHADAWFAGADDNAGGLATAVALARYFAKRPKPQHTLVFLISAGHHTPGMGVPSFRLRHENDYVADADLIINLEHIASSDVAVSLGQASGNNFGKPLRTTTVDLPKAVAVTNRAPFLIDLWRTGAECFGLSLQRSVDQFAPGELLNFVALSRMTKAMGEAAPGPLDKLRDITDVPMTQMISAGPFYHTSGETVDLVPTAALERAARFYAFFIAASDGAAPALLKGAPWTPRGRCPATP